MGVLGFPEGVPPAGSRVVGTPPGFGATPYIKGGGYIMCGVGVGRGGCLFGSGQLGLREVEVGVGE